MPDPLLRFLLAAVLAAGIAVVARRRRLLDGGGAVAAVVVGSGLVGAGGWWAGSLLVAFFVTSSLLSTAEHESPSRTWQQVVANGGPATLFAILAVTQNEGGAVLVACAAALAGATADTWATEIGRRSGAIPRSITTLKPVPIGTSGAVSLPGTVATVLGALAVAVLAVLLHPIALGSLPGALVTIVAIALGGTCGSVVDTLLGATVQAKYRCETCGVRAETPLPDHDMRLESGIALLTNNAVNAIASLIAGGVAIVVVIVA